MSTGAVVFEPTNSSSSSVWDPFIEDDVAEKEGIIPFAFGLLCSLCATVWLLTVFWLKGYWTHLKIVLANISFSFGVMCFLWLFELSLINSSKPVVSELVDFKPACKFFSYFKGSMILSCMAWSVMLAVSRVIVVQSRVPQKALRLALYVYFVVAYGGSFAWMGLVGGLGGLGHGHYGCWVAVIPYDKGFYNESTGVRVVDAPIHRILFILPWCIGIFVIAALTFIPLLCKKRKQVHASMKSALSELTKQGIVYLALYFIFFLWAFLDILVDLTVEQHGSFGVEIMLGIMTPFYGLAIALTHVYFTQRRRESSEDSSSSGTSTSGRSSGSRSQQEFLKTPKKLSEFLQTPLALAALHMWLPQAAGRRLLFLKAVEEFRSQEAQARVGYALLISQRYLLKDSYSELDVDRELVRPVKKILKEFEDYEGATLDEDLFEPIEKVVRKELRPLITEFRSSADYKEMEKKLKLSEQFQNALRQITFV